MKEKIQYACQKNIWNDYLFILKREKNTQVGYLFWDYQTIIFCCKVSCVFTIIYLDNSYSVSILML